MKKGNTNKITADWVESYISNDFKIFACENSKGMSAIAEKLKLIDFYKVANYSTSFQESIKNTDINLDKIQINVKSFKEELDNLETFKSFGNLQVSKLNHWYKKKLKSSSKQNKELLLNLKKRSYRELFELLEEEKDDELRTFIEEFITNKIKTQFYKNGLKKLSRTIRLFINILTKFNRNIRFYFRKILSFFFKNLDDYHDYIIIVGNLFATKNKLHLITINNYIKYEEYIRKNR